MFSNWSLETVEIYNCAYCKDQYVDGQVIPSGSGMMCPSCLKIVELVIDYEFKSLSEKYFCAYCDDVYSYGQLVPNGNGLMCPNCLKMVIKIIDEDILIRNLKLASISSEI